MVEVENSLATVGACSLLNRTRPDHPHETPKGTTMRIQLADLTDRPYFPQETRTRLVNAINFAAAYEAAELADLNDAIGDEMDGWDMTGPDYDDDAAAELIERIISIAGDYGYSIECPDEYPGYWIITDDDGVSVQY